MRHSKARKLTDAQHLEVLVRVNHFGELQASVARDLKVSQTTISQIINGKVYRSTRDYQYALPFKKEEIRHIKKRNSE